MDDSSSEDLFSLINFSGEQEEHLSEPPQPSSSTSVVSHKHITFMEPNIDVLIDYPVNKLYEKYFRQNELPCNINTYKLEIAEQPVQCRISSDNDKDRRPIDPAPIIKLTVLDKDNQRIQDPGESPFYVMHVSLWSVDMKTQYDLIENSRVLTGSLVSSPSLLKDLQDELAYFFAFSDLSIRLTGQYRLRFSLVHIARNEIVDQVFSDPFTTYSAKTYPGMKKSSELAKHLAKQGLKITIRTQTRSKK
ncbi:hypothetical protein G6F70_000245 [Rhizopus microsporus]|uniref:Velvet domain-containing protein n=1 Tax=Rhizopus microsporus TaxID=58291 RepID=A0A1X0S733_RHIZD|nr:hypothetical protein G6F71_001557 [Rhizopus microsporus]KAG1204641.1 hypothetical protein G6F70_000245 [Rhizopus microsporus]KAG1216133.1 hypothetical protein G6F69_000324 [Rhizopus microsporus]KAG1238478.1 hypothetical protein G6F67_000369 [Rhizopus microsporus]KAG1268894.1 hypothetical protein G6F68_000746 [Rhizopus microsporus]